MHSTSHLSKLVITTALAVAVAVFVQAKTHKHSTALLGRASLIRAQNHGIVAQTRMALIR